MVRTTRTLPYPGPSGLPLPALLRRVPPILLAVLLAVMLAACDGNEEPRATETATPAPAADETVPGGIETAARTLLADELDVDEEDFRLDSSEGMGWSDTSLGCPEEGRAYAQVLTSGYKLVFGLAGTSYAVHTNSDGSHMVICEAGQ